MGEDTVTIWGMGKWARGTHSSLPKDLLCEKYSRTLVTSVEGTCSDPHAWAHPEGFPEEVVGVCGL